MSLSTVFPFDYESQALDQKLAQDGSFAQGYAMDPTDIAGLSTISRDYPWLEPGAAVGLAQAGLDSYSPAVQQTARVSLAKQIREQQVADAIKTINNKNSDIGDLAKIPKAVWNSMPADMRQAAQAEIQKNGFGGSGLFGGGGFLGTGIHPDIAYSLGRGLAGDIAGAALGPSEQRATAADTGGIQGLGVQTGDVTKGVVRTAGLAAQTLQQEVPAFIRSGAEGVSQLAQGHFAQGLGYGNAPPPDIVGQTQAGQAVRQGGFAGLITKVGSGYLPDQNVQSAQAAAEAARQAAPTINGHAFTIGRATALGVNRLGNLGGISVAEPDSFAFNAISGGIDAGIAWKSDPANALIRSVGDARAARQVFEATRAPLSEDQVVQGVLDNLATSRAMGRVFQPAIEDANRVSAMSGLVASTERPTYSADAVKAFVDSPLNERVLQKWAAIPADRRAGAIWHDTGGGSNVLGQTQRSIPVLTAQGQPFLSRLAAAADDPTDPIGAMKAVQQSAVPTFQPAMMPGGFNYWMRSNVPDSRVFNLQPEGGLWNPLDKETFAPQYDAYLATGKVDLATRQRLLTDYINSTNKDELANSILAGQGAVEHIALAAGASPEKAREVGTLIGHEQEQARAFALDGMTGEERMRPGAVWDGTLHVLPEPEYDTERMNSMLEFPDPRELRRATSAFAPVVSSKPWSTLLAPADWLLNTWRPLHLIGRFGLPVRILADSQASLAVNGYDSLVNHPGNAISAMIGASLDKPLGQRLGQAWSQAEDEPTFLDRIGQGLGLNVGAPGTRGPSYIGDIIPHLGPGAAMDSRQAAQDYQTMRRLQVPYMGLSDDPSRIGLREFVKTSRDQPGAAEGMLAELGRMRGDPKVQGLLQQPDLQAAKDWFAEGEGAVVRQQFAPDAARLDEINRNRQAIGTIAGFKPYGALDGADPMLWRANSDALVESLLSGASSRTGGDERLLDLARTGQMNGKTLYSNDGLNRDLIPDIQNIFDEGAGPEWVKTQRYMTVPSRKINRLDYLTKQIFQHLVTLPDRVLNQNLAWVQSYWRNSEKYVPWLDRTNPTTTLEQVDARINDLRGAEGTASLIGQEAAMNRLVDLRNRVIDAGGTLTGPSEYDKFMTAAEKGGLPTNVMDRLRAVPEDLSSTDRMTFKNLQYVTKADAAHEMFQLTHNIAQRSNAGDMLRFLFPFGDAFRLIAQRWIANVVAHPNVLERVRQGLTALEQQGSGSINRALGDVIPSKSGFFHVDPQTGQHVFTYPGSTWLNDRALGVPIPLSGSVQGLSLVGDGYPGFGFGVTLPAAWFLPDTPQFDGVRNVIFPYGAPDGSDLGQSLSNEVEPAWFKKMWGGAQMLLGRTATAPADQKTFNNTASYIADYLASTGNYDLFGPNARKDTVRLVSDAKEKARWFYLIRGAAQNVSPSSPSPDWLAQDKSGHLAAIQTIRDDYKAHMDGDKGKGIKALGPDGALQYLIDHYGDNNVFLAQPFSETSTLHLPTNSAGEQWVRANPDIAAKYPTTYGFFAPQGGKFDITAFESQFTNKGPAGKPERVSLSPEQMVAEAESRVGQWQYFKARDQMVANNDGRPLNTVQQQWLSTFRSKLAQNFPGFATFQADPFDRQKQRQTAITELIAAGNDPKIATTDAGQGLQDYLTARDQAIQAGFRVGLRSTTGWAQAKRSKNIRDSLRAQATAISKQHPDFRQIYEQVFQREMNSDGEG
jgi:hypothetical protein